MYKQTIERDTAALVRTIREYVRSQAETWQLVPYLALEADGRSGYSDNYARAYRQGVWAIESSARDGSYTVYVDLATGELVNPFSFHEQARCVDAYDSHVLALATNLDQLDAAALVAGLEAAARKPIASYYDPQAQRRWRVTTRSELKLAPRYDPACRVIAPLSYGG